MNIVDTIQERCKDHRLVEHILAMSDECESDYMSGPTGVDFNTNANRSGSAGMSMNMSMNGQQSFAGRFKSFLFSE